MYSKPKLVRAFKSLMISNSAKTLPKICVAVTGLSFSLYWRANGLGAFPKFEPRGPAKPFKNEVFVPPNATGPPVISKTGIIG